MRQLGYLLLLCVLITSANPLLYGQNFKSYRDWSEPLFIDNAGDYNAKPGFFEFNLYYGRYWGETSQSPELGWEMETSFSKKFCTEIEFYTGWTDIKGESFKVEKSRASFTFQYNITSLTTRALSVGLEILSPGYSRFSEKNTVGWGFNPYIIHSRKWVGGWDAQFRFIPHFQSSGDKLITGATFHNTLFWQNDIVGIGMELGGGKEQNSYLAFAAPQLYFFIGELSIYAGLWVQKCFLKEYDYNYFCFGISYNWG